MSKLHRPIFVLFFSLICSALVAQNYYTVQIGTFRKASLKDFNTIKSYGYIYADIQLDNTNQVHVGDFASKKMAARALAKIKSKGFKDAFVKTHPLKKGRDVSVVQVGTFTLGQKIPWAKYLNMGRIHTQIDGNKVKIMSGVFADKTMAESRLVDAHNRGFYDAFIKNVNSQYLHPVNVFETNGLAPMAKVEVVQRPTTPTYQQPVPVSYSTTTMTAKSGSTPTYRPVPTYIAPTTYAPTTYTPTVYNTYSPPAPATVYKPQATKAFMPSISYKQKKNAIKWLQEVLQQTGVYNDKISSYYNGQTAAAYEAAKSKNYQLARFANHTESKNYSDFRDWKDLQLLLNLANSLSPNGQRPSDASIKEMYKNPETLDLNELQLIVSWDYRFRKGLEAWASSDMLRGEMARALKIAYFQSQLRLENYYKKKGHSTKQAQGLAFTALKMLVGEQLDRFQ